MDAEKKLRGLAENKIGAGLIETVFKALDVAESRILQQTLSGLEEPDSQWKIVF
jgi:hypothetical protein